MSAAEFNYVQDISVIISNNVNEELHT